MVTPWGRALVAAGVIAAVVSPNPAFGEQPDRRHAERPDYVPGLALGARTGWGFPFGNRATVSGETDPMGPSGNFSGILPLWADAGYRLSKRFTVGAYFQYGFLFVPEDRCSSPPLTGCTAHDIRFGAELHFHILPLSAVDPWVGLGIGYEASTLTIRNEEQSATRTNGGLEIANLQLGADVHSTFGFDWGPFGSFSVNEYATETQSLPDGSTKTYSLQEATIHFFLVLGMRAQFDL